MTGRSLVVRGDARALPLPDASVDLIVTSPPYFALRSYQDGGEHYAGQIGSEATPAEFLDALIACTREWVRVLKPSGSLFVNLGDSYYSGKGAPGRTTVDAKSEARTVRRDGGNPLDGPPFGVGRKSLIGIPWRYALRCIDDLGLILRAEIVWSKPNGLPESVTDRVRRSHEQWFHLTLQPRYYSAVDEVREPVSGYERAAATRPTPTGQRPRAMADTCNPLGKLPGSVWTVPTEPLKVPAELGVDHFAAFPTEWPRRIITGWSPRGVCVECGEGRRPIAERTVLGGTPRLRNYRLLADHDADRRPVAGATTLAAITGYVCACPEPTAPTTPGVVLDPFGGTGTTALVAAALGRVGVSVDLSHDYSRLARWRTTDPGEIAKAMRVQKPAEQLPGQSSLFDGEEATA